MASPTLFDPLAALAEIRGEPPQKLSQAPARDKSDVGQRVSSAVATLATLAGAPSAHDLAPARVKEEVRKNYIIITYTYARRAGTFRRTRCRARTGPARVARPASVWLSHSAQTISVKTAVARVSGGLLREWRRGLGHLAPDRAPCPDYRGDEWPRVLSRALAFLDEFGERAVALGWTAPRLFGVHPVAGIVRVDACGALTLPTAGPVRTITATEILFGHLTHREKPGQPSGVPWWEFRR